MLPKCKKIVLAFLCSATISVASFVNANVVDDFSAILAEPENAIDLAQTRLLIEDVIYDDIDINKQLNQIDLIVDTIKGMDDYGETSLERMGAILRYLYTPGSWNDYKAYTYDLSDPFGHKNPRQKSVSNYLDTKLGNCISMPVLALILAQRLGVNAKLAIAPSHAYVKYIDENGNETNIETTSGTLLSNEKYISAFEITSLAVKQKAYLKALSTKETIAFLLYELGRKLMKEGNLEAAGNLADLMLEYHPTFVDAMLLKGNVAFFALRQTLKENGISPDNAHSVSPELKVTLDRYLNQNKYWYDKAESLGWVEPAPDFDQRYAASIEKFKARGY